jgi:hypothetical protein
MSLSQGDTTAISVTAAAIRGTMGCFQMTRTNKHDTMLAEEDEVVVLEDQIIRKEESRTVCYNNNNINSNDETKETTAATAPVIRRLASSDGRAVRVVSGRGFRYVLPFPYKLQ